MQQIKGIFRTDMRCVKHLIRPENSILFNSLPNSNALLRFISSLRKKLKQKLQRLGKIKLIRIYIAKKYRAELNVGWPFFDYNGMIGG